MMLQKYLGIFEKMSMDYGPFSIQVCITVWVYCQIKQRKNRLSLLLWLFSCAKPTQNSFGHWNKKIKWSSSLKYHFSSFEKVSTWHQINDRVLSKKLTELMNWKIPWPFSTCRLFWYLFAESMVRNF